MCVSIVCMSILWVEVVLREVFVILQYSLVHCSTNIDTNTGLLLCQKEDDRYYIDDICVLLGFYAV